MLEKLFVGFLVLQFLNVQIQYSFATEAVIQNDAAVQARIEKFSAKVSNFVSHLSERAQVRLAYRLMRLNVKLRNKVAKKSDAEIQSILNSKINTEQELSEEDKELGVEVRSVPELNEFASEVPAEIPARVVRAKAILEQTDPVLKSLGATEDSNGNLMRPNRAEFEKKLFESKTSSSAKASGAISRAPAGVGEWIVRILVSLFIIAFGLLVITIAFAYLLGFAIAAAFSGISVSFGWFFFLVAGVAVGCFYGVRIIIWVGNTSHAPTRKLVHA